MKYWQSGFFGNPQIAQIENELNPAAANDTKPRRQSNSASGASCCRF
jgi:hypothetical protein